VTVGTRPAARGAFTLWRMTIALSGALSVAATAAGDARPLRTQIVLATRVGPGPDLPEGSLQFVPYDPVTGQLEGHGVDVPGHPFHVGRWIGLVSNRGFHEWRIWTVDVEPGSYVLASAANPNLAPAVLMLKGRTFAFEVLPGRPVYIGDYSLYLSGDTPRSTGQRIGETLLAFFTLGLSGRRREYGFMIGLSWDDEHAAAPSPAARAHFARANLRPVTLTEAAPDHFMVHDEAPTAPEDPAN
jgi:hypothetical protein